MEIENNKKKYFSNLFLKDKEQNLIERIEYFKKTDFDFYNRKIGFAQIVYNNYWVVIPINNQNFAFSVGMNYNFNLPEIMIIADSLTQKEFQILINEINCFSRDNRNLQTEVDYFNQIIIKQKIDFETYPEDSVLPEEQRRLKIKKGEDFKLVNVEKPLIFKEYDKKTEEKFPCGYLRAFNYYFTDNENIDVLFADLR